MADLSPLSPPSPESPGDPQVPGTGLCGSPHRVQSSCGMDELQSELVKEMEFKSVFAL